jgi:cytoskeleton protein RodZ
LADATFTPAASLATVEAPALATPAPWVFASPAVESHGVTGSPQDQTAPPSVTARISAADTVRPPLADTAMPPDTGRPSPPAGTRIVLRAKADSWLQVRDRQGPVLLSRVLRTGETWPVPPSQSPAQLLLSTGNAGGTEVLVDGDLTAALGKDGEVRRNLLLDPDTIRDGRLASRSAMPRKAD